MKKFFKQKINIARVAMIALILSCGVGIAAASYGAPGTTPSPLIHIGGGEQSVNELRIGGIGGGTGPLGAFNTRSVANGVTFFSKTYHDAIFRVLVDMYALNQLYIGAGLNTAGKTITASPEIAIWKNPQGLSNLLAPLQQVNVSGNVRANNLTHTLSSPANVCTTTAGVLELCPIPTAVNGACGTAVLIPHSTPPTTGLCSTGTASGVTTNPNTYDWYCYGNNGGTTAACSATRIIPQTYHWHLGEWSECNATGFCAGNPSNPNGQGAKIDWNGMPLDWQDGAIYEYDRNIRAHCSVGMGLDPFNPPNDQYNLVLGQSFDYNAGWQNSNPPGSPGKACITQYFPPDNPNAWSSAQNAYYEANLSTGTWWYVTVRGGVVGMEASEILSAVNSGSPLYETGREFRARCDINKDGTINNSDSANANCTPGNPGANSTVLLQQGLWQGMNTWCAPVRIADLTAPAKNRNPIGTWNFGAKTTANGHQCIVPSTISCSGQSQMQCSGIPGCNWNNQQGTQTRTVVCHNQSHTPVNEQLCIDNVGPKPPTSQACG